MKYLLLFIVFLAGISLHAQMSAEEKTYVDSLKNVVAKATSDTIKVNAWIAWDDVIWYYDPDLDLELNNKVKSLCSKNLKKNTLSKKEKLFYKMNYAKAMHNMGVIYFGKGNYTQAVNQFNESLKIKEEIGDLSGAGASINNIGNVYLEQGINDKAKEYYERSLKIFRKLNDDRGKASALGNLGLICSNNREFDQALKYQQESFDLSKKLDDKQRMAVSISNIGQIYSEWGKYEKALECFEQGLQLYQELGDAYGVALSKNDFGNTYLKQKKYNQAIAYSTKSLALAKEREAIQLERDAYHTLYQGYEGIGDYRSAFKNFKAYVELNDSLISEENQQDIIRQEYEYSYKKKVAEDSVKAALADQIQNAELEAEKAKNEQRTLELKQQDYIMYAIIVGLAIAIAFGWVAFNRFRVANRQKLIIEDQKRQVDSAFEDLEEKNQEILDSIIYARRIQSAILPAANKMKNYLKDHFVLYRPKDIVAGDFYWLEHKDDITLFAVADCTGHGVPGAMVSVVCNNGLNRSVREHGLTDPGEILNKTREIVIQEFEKSEDDVNDGMDIALCALKGNTLQYAGAHNPLWVIRNGALIEFKADKQPIGKFEVQNPYKTHVLELQVGDTLYLFTDGFADQFGGKEDRKYMVRNFKELLLSIHKQPLSEQQDHLSKEFDNWKGEREQVDDVCVLGIRI